MAVANLPQRSGSQSLAVADEISHPHNLPLSILTSTGAYVAAQKVIKVLLHRDSWCDGSEGPRFRVLHLANHLANVGPDDFYSAVAELLGDRKAG